MAIDGIRIVVDDAAVLAALSRLEQRDRRKALATIGEKIVSATHQRFQDETGPDGKRWQRLSPRTANKRTGKGRRGYNRILRDSLALSGDISSEADSEKVVVGTNIKYAAIQQLGGTIEKPARRQTIYQRYDAKSGSLNQRFVKPARSNFMRDVDVKAHTITIPARPYLGISDEDRKDILEIIANQERAALQERGR